LAGPISLDLENAAGGVALTGARLQVQVHPESGWWDLVPTGDWIARLGADILRASWTDTDDGTGTPDGLAAGGTARAVFAVDVAAAVRLQVQGDGATVTARLSART